MRKKILMTAAVAATVLGVTATSVAFADPATTPAAETGLDPELLSESLDELHETSAASLVASARLDGEEWSDARGPRGDLYPGDAKATDRVRLASLTKSMVTTVVLQLVDEGELTLDDTIDEYLPGMLPYEQDFTIRQLLGHTSGIPDYFIKLYPSLAEGDPADLRTNRYDYYTPEQIIEAATKDEPLWFEPGTNYAYSNTNYYLIGLALKEITGEDLDDLLDERVLDPVGMDDSYLAKWSPFILGKSLDAYVGTGVPGEPRINTTGLSPTQMWAAGAMVGNMADVNDFFRAMYDGTLLPAELIAEAQTLSDQSGGTYGLGTEAWPIQCDGVPGGYAYGHTGGGLGHTTFSFHTPDGNRQMSFTMAYDMQLEPSDPLIEDLVGLIVAGLCGVDVDDPSALDGGDDLRDRLIDGLRLDMIVS